MKNLADVVSLAKTPNLVVADRLASYHRSLSLAFEREAPEGVTRENGRLEGDHLMIEDRVLKTRVWLIDSLLWTIEELVAGRAVYASRGFLQATGYAGVLDGLGARYYTAADAFIVIKNLLEDFIAKGEK